MKIAKMLRNRQGFTLVELMVVVVILGILAAVAVPMYTNSQQTAERRAVEANLRIIDGAISQYQANNNGANPTSLDALVEDSYLQSKPAGPGSATYSIGGTPLRGLVSGKVGGKDFTTETPLTSDMWD